MRRLSVLGGLLAAAVVVLSGCSTSNESAAILAPVTLIDGAGFHGMDTALAASGGTIDPQWLGKTRNARIAVASTTWPDELEAQAQAFVDAAAKLQAALESDDVAAAAAPAHDAHETQHDLSADTYNYLAGKAGIAVPRAEAGH
jgi:hypothetical protein